MLTESPSGLDEIILVFGSLDDSAFEQKNIVTFDLPYSLLFDDKPVTRSRCHKLLVDNFKKVFLDIKAAGLENVVKNYGGIYAPRPIRGHPSHPSTHSWGIAIDLEPEKFPLGSQARFPDDIITIFRNAGFFYGGDFKSRKDPMHFQFCTNY